jgi:hypothetical protein
MTQAASRTDILPIIATNACPSPVKLDASSHGSAPLQPPADGVGVVFRKQRDAHELVGSISARAQIK